MSNFEKDMGLEIPLSSLAGMTLKAILLGAAGGALIGLVSLNRLTALLFPVIAIVAGWLIFHSAYHVIFSDGKQSGYMVRIWNHLIVIVACLFGGLISALTKASICYFIFTLRFEQLERNTTCPNLSVLFNNLLSSTIVSALLIALVPTIFVVLYFLRKDRSDQV